MRHQNEAADALWPTIKPSGASVLGLPSMAVACIHREQVVADRNSNVE
jgi:hypothetical protein